MAAAMMRSPSPPRHIIEVCLPKHARVRAYSAIFNIRDVGCRILGNLTCIRISAIGLSHGKESRGAGRITDSQYSLA